MGIRSGTDSSVEAVKESKFEELTLKVIERLLSSFEKDGVFVASLLHDGVAGISQKAVDTYREYFRGRNFGKDPYWKVMFPGLVGNLNQDALNTFVPQVRLDRGDVFGHYPSNAQPILLACAGSNDDVVQKIRQEAHGKKLYASLTQSLTGIDTPDSMQFRRGIFAYAQRQSIEDGYEVSDDSDPYYQIDRSCLETAILRSLAGSNSSESDIWTAYYLAQIESISGKLNSVEEPARRKILQSHINGLQSALMQRLTGMQTPFAKVIREFYFQAGNPVLIDAILKGFAGIDSVDTDKTRAAYFSGAHDTEDAASRYTALLHSLAGVSGSEAEKLRCQLYERLTSEFSAKSSIAARSYMLSFNNWRVAAIKTGRRNGLLGDLPEKSFETLPDILHAAERYFAEIIPGFKMPAALARFHFDKRGILARTASPLVDITGRVRRMFGPG